MRGKSKECADGEAFELLGEALEDGFPAFLALRQLRADDA
jgi:hypothetical protein